MNITANLETALGNKIVWKLSDNHSDVWSELTRVHPNIKIALDKFFDGTSLTFASELSSFMAPNATRCRGSRRAFYITDSMDYVFAVKGSEVFAKGYNAEFEKLNRQRIDSRPWSLLENFIYREQKIPYAVSMREGFEECKIGALFQQKSLASLGKLTNAPVPLYLYQVNINIEKNYRDIVGLKFEERARQIVDDVLSESGLCVIVYYYPYLPERIRFNIPSNGSDFRRRGEEFEKTAEELGITSNPFGAVENLIHSVAKVLCMGYLPFSRQDHGIGQCIAPQNVTLAGDITDIGSLTRMDEIQSFGEFSELYYSMFVVLIATIKELLIKPLRENIYEFSDPTPNSVIFSNFLAVTLSNEIRQMAGEANVQIDPRLLALIEQESSSKLKSVLESIYDV